MRLLIVGGTRFIGAAVAQQLMNTGHDVTVFHRGRTESPWLPRVQHLHGDRADLEAYRPVFRRQRPDVVIDMVARTEKEALATVRTFAGSTRKLVVASSLDVYRNYEGLLGLTLGPPDPVPLAETAPLRRTRFPRRPSAAGPGDWRFDYDKICVERACRAKDLAVTILRLPFVYGPGDYRRRLLPLLQAMGDGEEMRISASRAAWCSTRGHVQNVAAAIVLAAVDSRADDRLFNLGEPIALTEAEWIAEVGQRVGWRGRIVFGVEGSPAAGGAGATSWAHHMAIDTGRLRRELGFTEPLTFAEGLAEAIAWERANLGP